jgi:hypothetical protein
VLGERGRGDSCTSFSCLQQVVLLFLFSTRLTLSYSFHQLRVHGMPPLARLLLKRRERTEEEAARARTSRQTCESGRRSKSSWIETGTRAKEVWYV